MTIETREKEIGEYKYRLTLFGAKQGERVLLRLIKALGPAVAAISMKGEEGLSTALSSFGEADLDYIRDAFVDQTSVIMMIQSKAGPQASPVKLSGLYDNHFARRRKDAFALIAWAIQENYSDFFGEGGITGFLGGLLKTESESPSPQASPGSSGES